MRRFVRVCLLITAALSMVLAFGLVSSSANATPTIQFGQGPNLPAGCRV